MDGILDGGSPRRGSLNSLHRQSSGSFSHGSKLTSPVGSSQTNNNNLNSLYKDLDKFTRYFIIKTVQVIVQSRIGESKKLKTECRPSGNDWFNINITDIPEVSAKTKATLDVDGFSVKSNWRVCCEISLKTSDGGRVILEHWIISNKSNLNSSQSHLLPTTTKYNSSQASPKSNHHQSNRSSPVHLSTSNNGTTPLSAINSTSSNRVRTATFSNTMRTRLNSIDDCPGGDNGFHTNKLSVGTNDENIDIKSSTSCFSLSSTPARQPTDQTTNTITASPSINSLSNNPVQGQSLTSNAANINNSTPSQQGSKTNTMSSIYTIYNRMSLMLKTLMTTTHIVPAYRLASKTSQSDSCVICYRVYTSSTIPYQNSKTNSAGITKGSIEDISYNLNCESPNRRSSSSNSSFGSINIRDFVGPDELDNFCPVLKIGSIKTDVNELDVSLCYRTDVTNSGFAGRSPRLRDMYNKILDDDCITAAKQLLAGNDNFNHDGPPTDGSLYEGNSAHKNRENNGKNGALNYTDQPLRPAFAAKEQTVENNAQQDPNLELVESAFDGLLQIKNSPEEFVETTTPKNVGECSKRVNDYPTNGLSRSTNAQSEPIQVPSGCPRSKRPELYSNLSSGSTPKSLTDSFVFVDLNPPFASEEQNDINSFFHGPSPAFNNGFDSLKDVDELTNQLAVIEANASQLDEFVDNICVSEGEETDE